MEIMEVAKKAADEEKACRYLQALGLLKTYTTCPFCSSERVGWIRRCIYKCYTCSREWSPRRGSVLEKTRLPYGRLLMLVKLFELEISAHKASKELGMAYSTVYGFYRILREGIYRRIEQEEVQLGGEVEADESYFGGRRRGKRGRGAEGKIPVFGIIEREGKVKVEVVPDVKAETLLKEIEKKVRRGSIIYTDPYKAYDTLVMHRDYFKHLRIDKGQRFSNGRVYINGIEGFWSYAKERLMKFHGVSVRYFEYYLKELEFRYNHRSEDLYTLILTSILLVDSNR